MSEEKQEHPTFPTIEQIVRSALRWAGDAFTVIASRDAEIERLKKDLEAERASLTKYRAAVQDAGVKVPLYGATIQTDWPDAAANEILRLRKDLAAVASAARPAAKLEWGEPDSSGSIYSRDGRYVLAKTPYGHYEPRALCYTFRPHTFIFPDEAKRLCAQDAARGAAEAIATLTCERDEARAELAKLKADAITAPAPQAAERVSFPYEPEVGFFVPSACGRFRLLHLLDTFAIDCLRCDQVRREFQTPAEAIAWATDHAASCAKCNDRFLKESRPFAGGEIDG